MAANARRKAELQELREEVARLRAEVARLKQPKPAKAAPAAKK